MSESVALMEGLNVERQFGFNLFLAPASEENLSKTILKSISRRDTDRHLDPFSREMLARITGGKDNFHFWAMTESKRGTYEKMHPGDIVLFNVKGTGIFSWKARISGKLESRALGEALWWRTPNLPWTLIYMIDEVEEIRVRKDYLNKELGYAPDYWLPGVICVDPVRLSKALYSHGTLQVLLEAASR